MNRTMPEPWAAVQLSYHPRLRPVRNGLNERDEFLLRMAIILYQIGKYVNLLGSSIQAWSMVKGTDIFGISDKEKDIVACIVYYDHKGMPSDDDEPFRILSDGIEDDGAEAYRHFPSGAGHGYVQKAEAEGCVCQNREGLPAH